MDSQVKCLILHPDDVRSAEKMGKQYIDLMAKRTSLDTQLSIHLVRLFI